MARRPVGEARRRVWEGFSEAAASDGLLLFELELGVGEVVVLG